MGKTILLRQGTLNAEKGKLISVMLIGHIDNSEILNDVVITTS